MQSLYLAMYGDKIDIGQALFISLFAMSIVFLVLLAISYLIDITALLLKKNKRECKIKAVRDADIEAGSNKNKSDNKDTIAVIAAAVAMYLGTSVDNIVIKKIKKVSQSDTGWTKREFIHETINRRK